MGLVPGRLLNISSHWRSSNSSANPRRCGRLFEEGVYRLHGDKWPVRRSSSFFLEIVERTRITFTNSN